MRDTPYMKEIVTVSGPHGEAIERIFFKVHQREEIRFSWWNGNKLNMRPLDVTEDELLPLMQAAILAGVFTPEFMCKLRDALASHLDGTKD